MAEWLALLLHIQEVMANPDRFFVTFISPSSQVLGEYLKLDYGYFISYHSTLYSLSYSQCH
jgi:hypothetical protein